MLSFATSPVSVRQRTIGFGALTLLGLTTLLGFAFARVPLPGVDVFVPMVAAAVIVLGLVMCLIVAGQALVARNASLAVFAGSFITGVFMVVPQILIYRLGGERGWIGAGNVSSVWSWIFAQILEAASIAVYLWFDTRSIRRLTAREIWRLLIAVVVVASVAAGALGSLAIFGTDVLPTIAYATGVVKNVTAERIFVLLIVVRLGILVAAAIVTRGRTVLNLWLIVVLAALLGDVLITLTAGMRFSVGWYLGRIEDLLAVGAMSIAYLIELTTTSAGLAELATIDGLTGVGNRRLYDDRLLTAYRNAIRHEQPLGLVLIDVDHFKSFNDAYGHLAGDDALRVIARVMKESLGRSVDIVARVGGEEFAVLLPASDEAGALVVAERIRRGIEALAIPQAGAPAGVLTVSLGATSLAADDSTSSFAARADAALYRAKALGRNRTVTSSGRLGGLPRLCKIAGSRHHNRQAK